MFRASTSLTLSLALVTCTNPDAVGGDTRATSTTGEPSSGSSTTRTSEGGSSTSGGSTAPGPTTGGVLPGSTSNTDTGGSTSSTDTGGSTSSTSNTDIGASTSSTSTGESTTDVPGETEGEVPLKVGLALKSLCSPDLTSVCGVTLDDKLVCWGSINDPAFQLPPGKVKSVSPRCFTSVLENGELHRLWTFASTPLSLPKGPFVLAGGEYPYGCAMAANNQMTCWVAEGYQVIEAPPPGPFLTINDSSDADCAMCGLRPNGALVCWKKPINGDWDESCAGNNWVAAAPGKYTKLMGSTFHEALAMNTMGQFVWFGPEYGGSIYLTPLFASGGFVEASSLVGLKQSGELLYFEKGKGDGVPVVPGAYTTFFGDQDAGCAIRKSDSRVVCWGESEYGQFDPPKQ